jgi:hypothetical protein
MASPNAVMKMPAPSCDSWPSLLKGGWDSRLALLHTAPVALSRMRILPGHALRAAVGRPVFNTKPAMPQRMAVIDPMHVQTGQRREYQSSHPKAEVDADLQEELDAAAVPA